jgi:hypothetical protein
MPNAKLQAGEKANEKAEKVLLPDTLLMARKDVIQLVLFA